MDILQLSFDETTVSFPHVFRCRPSCIIGECFVIPNHPAPAAAFVPSSPRIRIRSHMGCSPSQRWAVLIVLSATNMSCMS